MNEKIIQRILSELKDPDLIEKLTNTLSNQDFNSLLLYLYDKQVEKISPAGLIRNYKNNKYSKPSDDNPVMIRKLELHAYNLLKPDFDFLALSPVLTSMYSGFVLQDRMKDHINLRLMYTKNFIN